MSTSTKASMNIENIADRASSYGIPGYILDGNDAIEVYTKMREIAEYVRAGNGPVLVESKTYRYLGHSKSDANVYRTKEEIEMWKQKDPIPRLKKFLLENQLATEEEIDAIAEKARAEIEAAVEFAESSPMPSLDTLLDDIYA